jgi:UDP-N-acetylglucosamine--N-acetylmuramyl-(pentapeptide) pyrophosphoryl-undecaprenol N-acetylglucosamine transferase
LIEQKELTGGLVADRLLALAREPARREAMAAAARRMARPDAAKRIVDRLLELAC